MSYLHLANGIPDFTQAVISLWFRVPQNTINAAAYDSEKSGALFNGIVPLVVMGKNGTHTRPDGNSDFEPTYVGAFCQDGSASLVVSFQTCKTPAIAGVPQMENFYDTVWFDGGQNIPISADAWHHMLISVQLMNIVTHGYGFDEPIGDPEDFLTHIESTSRLYIAFDDVNKTGVDLSSNWPNGYSDVQGVASGDALTVANSIQAFERPADPHEPDFPTGPIPTFSSGTLSIPCGGHPIGLPATTEFMDNIHLVEMAEFQMFTGLTLDTGVTANRRAFVGNDGKPVPPDQKRSRDDNGNIIQASGSIELLGKRPEILLHGSNNWIAGYNTGSTGVSIETIDGEEVATKLPAGQFDPIAGIEKYKPEPSLEETTA